MEAVINKKTVVVGVRSSVLSLNRKKTQQMIAFPISPTSTLSFTLVLRRKRVIKGIGLRGRVSRLGPETRAYSAK